jgi:hypothetical protein
MILILGNKCCNRGRLGDVLEPGYKYEPLVFVIGDRTISQQTGPVPTFESFKLSRRVLREEPSIRRSP